MSRSVEEMLVEALVEHDIGGASRTLYDDGSGTYVLLRSMDELNRKCVQLVCTGNGNPLTKILWSYPDGQLVVDFNKLDIVPYFVRQRVFNILNNRYMLEVRSGHIRRFSLRPDDHGVPINLATNGAEFGDTMLQRYGRR